MNYGRNDWTMRYSALILNALDAAELRRLAKESEDTARELKVRAADLEHRKARRKDFKKWLEADRPLLPREARIAERVRRNLLIVRAARTGLANKAIAQWLEANGHGRLTPAWVGAIVRREFRRLDRRSWIEDEPAPAVQLDAEEAPAAPRTPP